MLTSSLMVVVGLVALLGGGALLVRGATALAHVLGVSPLIIGLTVVAFGTSAPELAVNAVAVLAGRSALSFGNIIGSNLANIGLILGASALVAPIKVARSTVRQELPFMLAATALVFVLSLDRLRGGALDVASRFDGIVLLVAFAAFLAMVLWQALGNRGTDSALVREKEGIAAEVKPTGPAVAVTMIVAGLAGVLLGSDWTVDGAVGVATVLGVDETIIGLTVVAVGTSLPELATSIIAVRAGQSDLALGNIVGSNIFNVLLVLGVTATISPVAVPAGGLVDLVALAVVSVALWAMAAKRGRTIGRMSGGLLLVAYLAYMVWRSTVG